MAPRSQVSPSPDLNPGMRSGAVQIMTQRHLYSGSVYQEPGEGCVRYVLPISQAAAFAFKAEILLFEQSQQLQLRPIRKLSRRSREEPDLAGFFWGPRQVAGIQSHGLLWASSICVFQH